MNKRKKKVELVLDTGSFYYAARVICKLTPSDRTVVIPTQRTAADTIHWINTDWH